MAYFLLRSLLVGSCTLASLGLEAVTYQVNSTANTNTEGTLPYALLNAGNDDIIDCSPIANQTIFLAAPLPPITSSCSLLGSHVTINGNSTYQGLSVASGNPVIKDISIVNGLSQGGNGGDAAYGGGGGVGGGGGLYIHGGTSVTISASSLINNTSLGGNGGNSDSNQTYLGGGGGGGFGGGHGGNATANGSFGGGGGGGHPGGGDGGGTSNPSGSDGLYFSGGGGGLAIDDTSGTGGNSNTFNGGAGGSGTGQYAGGGGAGSSEGGFAAVYIVGGNGGMGIGSDSQFGGGGGGGGEYEGGNGVGAGGGGGSYYGLGVGGILGGGGAGSGDVMGGPGGFGAGGGAGYEVGGKGGGGFYAGGGNGGESDSGSAGGGGGSGLGGGIFIQNTATLIIGDGMEFDDNYAIAGIGGTALAGGAPGEDGLALGTDIFIRQGGEVVFSLGKDLNLLNPIAGDLSDNPGGSGGIVKRGAGILSLNGDNTYNGNTVVNEGELNLNGSVVGNVLVNLLGRLSGNATIGGNLICSGTLAPGNSIGTVIINGNFTLVPDSIVAIEVNAEGESDLIIVTGTAELNGTLNIMPLPGFYDTVNTYTIITSGGGVSGTFARVESEVPSLTHAIYDPNEVRVQVLPLDAIGLSSNALQAASCFVNPPASAAADADIVSAALLSLDFEGIQTAFNQIQPSYLSALGWTQLQNALLVRSTYSQHLNQIDWNQCSSPYDVWISGMGQWQHQNSKEEQFGFNDATGGVTLGADTHYQELRFGAAFSYTNSHLRWKQSVGHANIDSYYGGLYGNWNHERIYINATLLGAYNKYRTKRHLNFGTIDREAKVTHHGWEGLAGVEIGIRSCYEYAEITPFVRMDYLYLSQQSYEERGAESLNLSLHRHNDQLLQTELGIAFSTRYTYGSSCEPWTLIPRLGLSYINQSPLTKNHYHAHFVDSTCDFTVSGWNFRRNLGAISLSIASFNCDDTMGLTLRYDGQFGSRYWNQSGNLAVDIKF